MEKIKKILKSDGKIYHFNPLEISETVVLTANRKDEGVFENIQRIVDEVLDLIHLTDVSIVTSGTVEDSIEEVLLKNRFIETARDFISYRIKKAKKKEDRFDLMDGVKQILIETSKENANTTNSPTAKLVQTGTAASHSYYLNYIVPEHIAEAHKNGLIHIHDLDYYSKAPNCIQLNLDNILKRGFHSVYGKIDPPQTIMQAVVLALAVLQNNQNDMYGGQSFPHFDCSMGNFIKNHCPETSDEEIYEAMKTMIIILNTVHCHCGVRAPFSTINFGTDCSREGRSISKALLKAFDLGMGDGQTPIFPNLVFRVKKGVNYYESDPNYDLLETALKVSSKRMNPTYSFMDASFNQKYGTEVSYMGCRSRVMANINGEEIAAGRGNLAPVTINLPRLALLSRETGIDGFYQELDKAVDMCRELLLHRFNTISKLKVKDFPVLMKEKLYLGSENLDDHDEIKDAIKNGTLAIGFIGLAEALKLLTGKHHGESEDSWNIGYNIIERLSSMCSKFTQEDRLNFVSYATPAEGLCGRFPVLDRKLFGITEGINDKDFYTNSFHLPVSFPISMFKKIELEGPFHKLTTAGHISYVELPSSPENNLLVMKKIIQYMCDNDIGYSGINFPIDECLECGNSGIFPDKCPACGSKDIRRIRRITGYLSTVDRFNHGKEEELKSRIIHGNK